MMQMATVFAELERSMIRSRVMAGLDRVRAKGKKTLGRPVVGTKVEEAIRQQLATGHGILKVANTVGCGSGTVQRVKKEMLALAEPSGSGNECYAPEMGAKTGLAG
jgi:DNA invertase Pin-like site-specific DNA recombinase